VPRKPRSSFLFFKKEEKEKYIKRKIKIKGKFP
jgi:hypothetical protein